MLQVVYFLMVILCSATLLHAGVVSDDDNRDSSTRVCVCCVLNSESETEAPTTSVAIDESTEDPDGYFLDELALRRKYVLVLVMRSAGGVGSLKTVAADSTSAGGVDSLKTVAADSTDIGDKKDAVASPVVVPDHSRTRREDKSKKAGGNPSAPATANENQGNNRRLPTIPEKSRAIRAAQSQ
ncbi:hypothetical protein PR048_008352 [Dryococelus australis]|uniref:Secreted protein n=1 Tax=Dryococelus australis TaxID=614101 RepID=A0ABQ9HWV2_9NEOP|nr:hypothetical protein PR048_008352 [Dryococelus australis]